MFQFTFTREFLSDFCLMKSRATWSINPDSSFVWDDKKEHSFDLPQGIVDQEFNDIWHRLDHAKKDGTLDEDDKKLSDDQLKKRYQEISQRRVKLAMLLQYIAKENKIVVDEKELSNGMMQYASQSADQPFLFLHS